MTTSNTVRIATVKATGERFVVNSLDFKANTARCWGQVVACAGARTTHEAGGPVFALSDVSVESVARTNALAIKLFEQTMRSRERRLMARIRADVENASDRAALASLAVA
jgi:hypothetical protein